MRFATGQRRVLSKALCKCEHGGPTGRFTSAFRTTGRGCPLVGIPTRALALGYRTRANVCGTSMANGSSSSRSPVMPARASAWISVSRSAIPTTVWCYRAIMDVIRTLVVDDEKPALTRIVELLEKQPDIDIVGMGRHG